MRNIASKSSLTLAIVIVMLVGACKEYEQLAGPLALDAQPVLLILMMEMRVYGIMDSGVA